MGTLNPFITRLAFLALCMFLLGSFKLGTREKYNSAAIQSVPNESGQVIFKKKCSSCHGINGNARLFGAANLQTSRKDNAAIVQIITLGRKAMPAYGKTLTSVEIQRVTEFVESLQK